jgi:predicted Zn-dependent protease
MKFTPKEIEGNVNVSPTHPLAELAWLVGGIAFLLVLLWFALGLATELAAAKIPIAAERWLGERALATLPGEADPALEARLQGLLQALPADSPLRGQRFTVHRLASDELNAVALPGGHIVVFAGLLQKVQSENELAMVLAHELGHFAHRDHLKGLGRGLGVAVAALLLLGPDNAGTQLASRLFLPLQARYSQLQEAAADVFGVDLLAARFGHAGGATDLFARLAREAGAPAAYLLASHPHPGERIAGIRARIAQQGWGENGTLPLAADIGPAATPGEGCE